jgi:hypothetical protein
MNVAFLAGVLRARAQLRSHDRWSRETLLTYYFCGKGCKLEFGDDPGTYLDPSHTPSM